MTHIFGWCGPGAGDTRDDAYCHLCPREYVTQVGVTVHCSCPNHLEEAAD